MSPLRLNCFLPIAVLAWACCAPRICWGQIYASAEAGSGALVLSNFETRGAVMVAGPAPTPSIRGAGAPTDARQFAIRGAQPSAKIRELVADVSRRTQVAPELIHAVISAESRYDSNAVSPKGAIGLMQLLPATGKRFGAQDLFSSEQNVSAGAEYLKWLMGVFGDDLELVVAAYNAGEQAVIRAGRRIPPYPETQAYVKTVMANLRR